MSNLGYEWSIDVVSDKTNGFEWYASRLGVLWAKGWVRSDSSSDVDAIARETAARAFEASK